MIYIKRAWLDTLKGQFQAIFVLVVGGVLALVYLHQTEGKSVAVEEVPYFWGALFGALGALLLLFLWNLACSPYRIERDEHNRTKEKLAAERPSVASTEEFVRSRNDFTLREAACLLAGVAIKNSELTGPSDGYLYDLRKKICRGEISNTNSDIDFFLQMKGIGRWGSAVDRLGAMSGTAIDEPEIYRCEISKETLKQQAKLLGRDIPGLDS